MRTGSIAGTLHRMPDLIPRPQFYPGSQSLAVGESLNRSGWRYKADLAQRIADDVSMGVSIPEQHAARPDVIPPPTVIAAWKRQHPAFGVMLRHAESVRADLLVEQALVVADSSRLSAPRVAIQVAQRMAMAERLDRGRWGRNAPEIGAAGMGNTDPQPTAVDVSDEALASIAVGGDEGGVFVGAAGERVAG